MLQKFPLCLELIHYEGKSEQAYVYKLHLKETPITAKQAEQRLLTGLMVYPENPNALFSIAMCYYNTKEFDKCISYTNQALKLINNSEQILELRANAYVQMQKFQLAAQDYERLTQLNPPKGTNWYNLGVCYFNLNKSNALSLIQKGKELGI